MGSDTDNKGERVRFHYPYLVTMCPHCGEEVASIGGPQHHDEIHQAKAAELLERMAALAGKAGPGEFADWLHAIASVCLDARDLMAAVQGGQENGGTDGD